MGGSAKAGGICILYINHHHHWRLHWCGGCGGGGGLEFYVEEEEEEFNVFADTMCTGVGASKVRVWGLPKYELKRTKRRFCVYYSLPTRGVVLTDLQSSI